MIVKAWQGDGFLRSAILSVAVIFAFVAASEAADVGRVPSRDRVLAREILRATGVQGGLVVHLGCGAGSLTAALRADGR